MTTTRVIKKWLKVIEDDWKREPVVSMDAEVCHTCQYPMPLVEWYPDGYTDCAEPATRWLWWGEYDSGMYVCKEHFQKIEELEKEEEAKIK